MKTTNNFSDKNLIQHLSKSYGIGHKTSLRICDDLGLCPKNLYKNYSASFQDRIDFYIQQHFYTDRVYRLIVKNDINRYIDISCYRGIRHSRGLPCRGQRTHGNAKTVKKIRSR